MNYLELSIAFKNRISVMKIIKLISYRWSLGMLFSLNLHRVLRRPSASNPSSTDAGSTSASTGNTVARMSKMWGERRPSRQRRGCRNRLLECRPHAERLTRGSAGGRCRTLHSRLLELHGLLLRGHAAQNPTVSVSVKQRTKCILL